MYVYFLLRSTHGTSIMRMARTRVLHLLTSPARKSLHSCQPTDDLNWLFFSPSDPCSTGEGDCEVDADCEGTLRCGFNNCGDNDPTGVNNYPFTWSICYIKDDGQRPNWGEWFILTDCRLMVTLKRCFGCILPTLQQKLSIYM